MSDVHRDFLRILDLMTGPMASADGFRWHIRSIDMLQAGPVAMFHHDWPGRSPSHDSHACMSVRAEGRFVIRPETCSMGAQTTTAQQALMNRFNRAMRTVQSGAILL